MTTNICPAGTFLYAALGFTSLRAHEQEYFFPKEDATVKQRQQQWVKSVALRRKSAAVLTEVEKSNHHTSTRYAAYCLTTDDVLPDAAAFTIAHGATHSWCYMCFCPLCS